jgi:hypothetical protein
MRFHTTQTRGYLFRDINHKGWHEHWAQVKTVSLNRYKHQSTENARKHEVDSINAINIF